MWLAKTEKETDLPSTAILINTVRRMKSLTLILGICTLCLLSACTEPKAKTSNPKHYSNDGLSFNYPENWQVTEDEKTSNLRYLFVETPGDAIVLFQFYGMENDMPLLEYCQTFSEGAKEETPVGSVSSPIFKEFSENKIEEKVSITVLNEVIPHRREYLKYTYDDEVCFLIFQVAEEDLNNTKNGFDLIVDSLEYKGSNKSG
jgi:hypothetical protein